MINVLINAYAVSPTWGSEPGMGWNWIINIAKHCNVFVITEAEWKNDILVELEKLPQKNNIHFYFNPVSEKVRRMCWNQGDWRFYWFYRKWQKKTLEIAKTIISQNKIDIIHQLNMIGFREPGYLWKIKNIPFVWGPVGGMGTMPLSFLTDATIKINVFIRLKNILNNIQLKYNLRVRNAIKKSMMIAATPDCKNTINKKYHKNIPLINETGLDLHPIESHKSFVNSDILRVIWVGKYDFRKRLDLAIKAVAESRNPNIELFVCGSGTPKQVSDIKDLCDTLKVTDRIHILGKVDHRNILKLMYDSDLMLFSSIADATSTVVSEAISVGLPILSHNLCGFGPIVEDFGGWTIPAKNSKDSIIEFGRILNYLQQHPEELEQKSLQAIDNRHKLGWDYKMKKLMEIYDSLVQ